MSFKSKGEIPTENRKAGLLNKIMNKYKECKDSSYLQIVIHHLKVYEKYLKTMEEKGPAAFPNRLEYQKFAIAKLLIDRISLLEFSLDPSFKGFGEYKDKSVPPLDAFSMTQDIKETRKIKFCRSIEKGDILHLRVVEESETEYKLLVVNKYDENERVVDYLIHAYMVKSYQLDKAKLPRPMQVNDYVRAAVLGKLKMEENVFSKLLVTLNNSLVNEKYKDVQLGLIFKSEIRYYPEDISNHSSFLNYMKAEKKFDDPQDAIKCMTSLGLDPYKTYSLDKSVDGKKLGQPKEIDCSTLELLAMEKSMHLIKEVENRILQGVDLQDVLPLIDEALRIYPQNDAAFAIRAQVWKKCFISENYPEFLLKALVDSEKALDLNPYNLTATRVYLTILYISAAEYKNEGKEAKYKEIMAILDRTNHICDVYKLLMESEKLQENKRKQSSTGEAQGAVVPMDLSDG